MSIISDVFLMWRLSKMLMLFIFWIHYFLLVSLFILVQLLLLGMMRSLTPFCIINSILWIRLKRVFHLTVNMDSFRVAFMLVGWLVLILLVLSIILRIYFCSTFLIVLRSFMTSLFLLSAEILLNIFFNLFVFLSLLTLLIFLYFQILLYFLRVLTLINLLFIIFLRLNHIFILNLCIFIIFLLFIWNARILPNLRSLSGLLILGTRLILSLLGSWYLFIDDNSRTILVLLLFLVFFLESILKIRFNLLILLKCRILFNDWYFFSLNLLMFINGNYFLRPFCLFNNFCSYALLLYILLRLIIIVILLNLFLICFSLLLRLRLLILGLNLALNLLTVLLWL